MNKTTLLLFLLTVSLSVSAKPRKRAEMCRIAQTAIMQQEVELLDETEGYCVFGNNKGFAIISKKDSHTPVLAYSASPYDKNNMPCGMKWWLSTINASLSINGQSQAVEGFTPEVVAPMLKTTWGQQSPFNEKSPVVNNSKAPTGCVATAMSQILNFYQYPAQGHGMGYYTMGENSYRQLVEVNSTYRWDLMKNSYASAWFLSDEEKDAISQLMFDAGVSSHMNFSSGGSGTTAYEAANGFSHIFQFDSLAMECVMRDYCQNDAEWMNIILSELKAGRPVLMCGLDLSSGGHAFIIDGMDANGYVHVNWGWNGQADGYYNLADLNPTGILGESSTMHFNAEQSIITNLRCNPTPAADAVYRSCWVISVEDNLIANEVNGLTLSSPGGIIWQVSHLTFYGKVGLAFLDDNGNEVYFHAFFDTSDKANHLTPIDGGVGYYASNFSNISITDLLPLPAGTYRVFLASKAIQDKTSQFICYPGGNHNEYILTKNADNTLIVKAAETSGIETASSIAAPDNTPLYDLQGRKIDSPRKGIYIQKGRKVVAH